MQILTKKQPLKPPIVLRGSWHEISYDLVAPHPGHHAKHKELNLKEIVLVGNDSESSSVLKHIFNSSKYKIRKAKNFKKADKIISALNPDFVLCAGKITVDKEGQYVLKID